MDSLPGGKSDSTVGVNTVVMSKIQVQDQMVDSCLLQDLPKPPIHNLWELDTISIKEDSPDRWRAPCCGLLH